LKCKTCPILAECRRLVVPVKVEKGAPIQPPPEMKAVKPCPLLWAIRKVLNARDIEEPRC